MSSCMARTLHGVVEAGGGRDVAPCPQPLQHCEGGVPVFRMSMGRSVHERANPF